MWPAIIAAGASMMGSSGGGQGGGGGGWQQYMPSNKMGGLASGIAGLFAENPYDAGKEYYDKIPGMMEGYYKPFLDAGNKAADNMQYYMDMGKQAGGTLSGQLNGLVNDPTAKMAQWGANFQQSPGYQWQVDQSLGAANRAAAAGGMVGSPMEQQQIAGTVNQLANQDYYNYLNHAQNLYGQGMSGLQNMYNMGGQMGENMYGISAQMASGLAENLGSAYMNQGNMANASSQWEGQNQAGSWGSITGSIF